jgi:hypothetical protein
VIIPSTPILSTPELTKSQSECLLREAHREHSMVHPKVLTIFFWGGVVPHDQISFNCCNFSYPNCMLIMECREGYREWQRKSKSMYQMELPHDWLSSMTTYSWRNVYLTASHQSNPEATRLRFVGGPKWWGSTIGCPCTTPWSQSRIIQMNPWIDPIQECGAKTWSHKSLLMGVQDHN